MPIRPTTTMDVREQIAQMALSGKYSITEIAELFDISRPTVYDYRKRYEQGGRESLADRSRAPLHPRRVLKAVRDRILKEHRRFGFGSKKIRRRMLDDDPRGLWPARSTIDTILSEAGLVKHRRRRARYKSPFRTHYVPSEPGEMATIDFKGEFRLRNGRWCHPLTMADAVSRYLFGLPSALLDRARRRMARCRAGLPPARLAGGNAERQRPALWRARNSVACRSLACA